jgi:transcriptional regulator with GAF, ATPase, and Fis domain
VGKAFLVGVMGPHQDATFSLEDEVTLGRDPANRVHLNDFSVSRRHCVIVRDGDQYLVRDLGSHNGTLLNGTAVDERALENGDRIAIGGSVFQFCSGDEAANPRPAEISWEESLTITTAIETSEVLGPETGAVFRLPKERLARDFGVLLKIAIRLRGIRDSESLLWQLIGVLLEVVPAERIAILLGPDAASLEPGFAWDKITGPGIPVRVSRTIVDRVMSNQRALMINDVPKVMPSTSAKELSVRSVVCAPLCTPDKQLGIIYMDCRNPGAIFDEGHLHLLSAIAGMAALSLENARFIEVLERENAQLKAEIREHFDMVGDGPAMQDLYRFIAKVAPSDSTVLIQGESGTGKELVARAIHQHSPRAWKPFIGINCAALTETLLESELFGHEKGAFTGAQTQKKGYLEVGEGGTVFLDEIGELALPLQAKLLRVLQERELVRVGGTKPIKVDVRIVTASNRVLSDMAKEGKFRQDLFYRLNVVSCQIPPLRKRREDIPMLAAHFVKKYSARCKRQVDGIAGDAIACITQYDWPGNVRELENAIEHAVVLGSTPQIVTDDLPEVLLESSASVDGQESGYHGEVAQRKKELILDALERANGSFTEAAKLLQVHPNYLHRLVRILDLRQVVKKRAV